MSGDVFSFFGKYGDLYEFSFALFEEKNIYADDIKSEQINFLKDLMNDYKVHKWFERFKCVNDLYLRLHTNMNRTAHDIFLKNATDKCNKKFTYRQKYCLIWGTKFFKKLFIKES